MLSSLRYTLPYILAFLVSASCIAGEAIPAFPGQDSTAKYSKKNVRVYYTQRLTTKRPVIDGKLDDDCWKTGDWAGDFTQFVPAEGKKPSEPTFVKILYDDKNIYVAIRAFDSIPSKIQRLAGLRDEIIGDMVGVNFDSYHDHRTGFEFDLSAYGQKVDLVLTNPMNWDVNWNPVWKGKVGSEDSAWTAEMEIPLSQLRYSKEKEQVWGLHVWRWINRLQEESDWEVQTLTGPGVMYNFGELRGIKDLKKSQRLEIMPFAVGQMNTFPREAGNPFSAKGRNFTGNMGLDAKIGLTSNFTVDMTVNPDFGQVESDPSVMNLTAFETFYEEKRPFFLEAKNIFDDNLDDLMLFYSRRIGHAPSYVPASSDSLFVKMPEKTAILGAVKLSGKTAKGLSVGFLESLTATEHADLSNLLDYRTRQTVEPMTNYLVARVQQDYNEGSTTLGGMITATNRFIHDPQLSFLGRDAYTGGLDLLHQWHDKKYYVDAKLVGSMVNGSAASIMRLQESSARYYQRPGATYLGFDTTRRQMNGYGARLRIGKGTGLWRYSTGASVISPGLELNDIGYMQTSDLVRQENDISYFVNQPVSIFMTYSVNLEQFNSWNFNSSYLGSGAHLSFSSQFRNKWKLQLNLIGHTQALDTRILRGGPDMIVPANYMTFGMIETDNSKKLYFDFNFDGSHSDQNALNNYQLAPGVVIRPVNTLKIGLTMNYAINHDQLQYVVTVNPGTGDRYIVGKVDQKTLGFTFRADYHITPEFSIQYYGSPFMSKGTFSEFKRVVDPENSNYYKRYITYANPVASANGLEMDENGDGTPDYTISNPDFNFHQFRSNLVVRWEYHPGSMLYLVWSSDRTGDTNPINTGMDTSWHQMWKKFPTNVFLIKFNYWFSL